MKLEKGKNSYTIPGMFEVREALFDDERYDHYGYALSRISWGQFHTDSGLKEEVEGRPTGFSVHGEEIKFWPTPDKEYEVKVYYQEHIKVM